MYALVVDDSRAMRRFQAKTLGELGFQQVEEAEHGRAALERIDAAGSPPALILLDWNMPVMTGFEFLVAFRARPDAASTKVLMVTTETGVDQMVSALDSGADEYLMKPFTDEALGEKINELGVEPSSEPAPAPQSAAPANNAFASKPVSPSPAGQPTQTSPATGAVSGSTETTHVLVVDDSVVVRRVVQDVLEAEGGYSVDVAQNGKIALSKLDRQRPDLVVLDVEMPVLDGLETLAELRRRDANLPILMFSSATGPDALTTIKALNMGASDFATKPSGGSLHGAQSHLHQELLPKIQVLTGREPAMAQAAVPAFVAPPPVTAPAPNKDRGPLELIVIGASTGGPNALTDILMALPGDFPVPILIAQHLPEMFSSILAKRWNEQCALDIAEGLDGGLINPGQVRLAPGDFHMTVAQTGHGLITRLDKGPPENSCRPAVDPLFRSAATSCGDRVLGVVLTGMGRDGSLGSAELKRVGAEVIVQDEATSTVWGMPRAVYELGYADRVLPLDDVATTLNAVAKRRTAAGAP